MLTDDPNGPVRDIAQNAGASNFDTPVKQYSAYFQDDWAFSDRVTLNVGLRYDLNEGIGGLELDQSGNRLCQSCPSRTRKRVLPQRLQGLGLQGREGRRQLAPRLGFSWGPERRRSPGFSAAASAALTISRTPTPRCSSRASRCSRTSARSTPDQPERHPATRTAASSIPAPRRRPVTCPPGPPPPSQRGVAEQATTYSRPDLARYSCRSRPAWALRWRRLLGPVPSDIRTASASLAASTPTANTRRRRGASQQRCRRHRSDVDGRWRGRLQGRPT